MENYNNRFYKVHNIKGGWMRTIISILSVLVVGGIVLAADSTSTAAPAPAAAPAVAPAPAPAPAQPPVVAPAPVAAPAPVPAVTPAPVPEPVQAPAPAPTPEKPAMTTSAAKPACAAPLLTWSGLTMLRLRDELMTNFRTNGHEEESATFSYQIAYKLGLKVRPNDETLLQFELGNDWFATEEAEGFPGNYYTKRNPMTPWFCLAFGQWDPGYMHIQAGIIPVKGTALMDLLGVSLFFNRNYKMAAHLPWGVLTNFSQTGLRLGAPIVKGPFSIGVDAMSAIIEQRPVYAMGIDSIKVNMSAVEFELDIPITVAGVSVTPQAFIIPARSFSKATGKSDIEFGSGFDFGCKVSDGMVCRAGFGYARNSNRETHSRTNTVYNIYSDPILGKPDTVNKMVDSAAFDRWGTNLNVGTTITLGPGKLDFDFNLSSQQNAYDTTVSDWYPFFDIKYGWALSKNFIVMPRVRLFFSELKSAVLVNGTYYHYNNMLKTRPELILMGTF
jgi:hypothetical protein